jgi:hypothetical protein
LEGEVFDWRTLPLSFACASSGGIADDGSASLMMALSFALPLPRFLCFFAARFLAIMAARPDASQTATSASVANSFLS